MEIKKIIYTVKRKKYIKIKPSELDALLAVSELIDEKDTLLSDKIRLLKYKDELLIQEKNDKDEFIIRSVKTLKEAEEFIEQRLEIYEKMWDGCGCRVEYYS